MQVDSKGTAVTSWKLWWTWGSYRAVMWVAVGSVSLGRVDLPWKENDNVSLSPLSDFTLPNSLSPQSTPLLSKRRCPKIHFQTSRHSFSDTPTFRCFSIQKYVTAAGFLRQVHWSCSLSVHGVQIFGWPQSSSKPWRHHGYPTSNFPLLQKTVGIGILPRILELSLPCQLFPRILDYVYVNSNCHSRIIFFSKKCFHSL